MQRKARPERRRYTVPGWRPQGPGRARMAGELLHLQGPRLKGNQARSLTHIAWTPAHESKDGSTGRVRAYKTDRQL